MEESSGLEVVMWCKLCCQLEDHKKTEIVLSYFESTIPKHSCLCEDKAAPALCCSVLTLQRMC